MILTNSWCSKCDCYWPRAHSFEDDRYASNKVTPVTRDETLRPSLCMSCKEGWCRLDLRLMHPERSPVTADWLEKRFRASFLSLHHSDYDSMSLKDWEDYHADEEGWVGRKDGCEWAKPLPVPPKPWRSRIADVFRA